MSGIYLHPGPHALNTNPQTLSQLFLTFRQRNVSVWNFRGEKVTTFEDHTLWSTLHPAPYTQRHTPSTLHRTPYTAHPTPCTLQPTTYSAYPTPHTLHRTPSIMNSILVHSTQRLQGTLMNRNWIFFYTLYWHLGISPCLERCPPR